MLHALTVPCGRVLLDNIKKLVTLTVLSPYSKNITISTTSFPSANKRIGFSTSSTIAGWDNIVISQGSTVIRENFNGGSWDSANFEVSGLGTGTSQLGAYSSAAGSRGVLRTLQDFVGTSSNPVTTTATLYNAGWWYGLSFIALRGDANNNTAVSSGEPLGSLKYRLHPFNNGQTTAPNGVNYNLTDAFYTTYPLEITIVDDGASLNATFTQLLPPQINSATYDGDTGILLLTGVNFYPLYGISNDVDVSKLAIVGESGTSYTLTSQDVEIASSSQISIQLNGTDRSALGNVITSNGTSAGDGTSYAVNASDDWLPGWHTFPSIADSSNPLTASNSDIVAPSLVGTPSSSANGQKIFLSYSEPLSSTVAFASAFNILINGASVPVASVSASGSTVELVLSSAIPNGGTVTVAYTDPSGADDSSAIQDLEGNDASSFTAAVVPDAAKPSLVSASTSADGAAILLVFDELLSATTATTSDFSVIVDGFSFVVRSVLVSGNRLELGLVDGISYGASVSISYRDPTPGNDSNVIQDLTGNDASSLNLVPVLNNVARRVSAASDSVRTDSAPGAFSIQTMDNDYDGIREVITAIDGSLVDGNGDGIADAEQPDVVGLRLINDGSRGSDYGALVVNPSVSIANVILTVPGADSQVQVATKDGGTIVTSIPADISNAFVGVLAFSVSELAAGGSTDVTIKFPSGLPAGTVNAYLRFNFSTNRFEEFLDANGTPLYNFIDSDGDGIIDGVTLTLVDGDPNWDGDSQVNGAVSDPGFLAYGERSLSGTKLNDTITGNVLSNLIKGKEGADSLLGGLGADLLIGGTGKNSYVYASSDESTPAQRDTVRVGKGDRFVFSSFDGDSISDGQQRLNFIGKQAFSGSAGELRATRSMLEADTNGDGLAEFTVNLRSNFLINSSNLVF